jgi:uncharacterized membrane protein
MEQLESTVRDAVELVIPIIEAIGAIVIAGGVLFAAGAYLLGLLGRRAASYEDVRLQLARFIALGLEFQLASDVLGTAVSPSFEQIGRLAAIAAIRTLLNFFLAKEIERAERMGREGMLPPLSAEPARPGAAALIRPGWWRRAERKVEAGA